MDFFTAFHVDFMRVNIPNFLSSRNLINGSLDIKTEIIKIFEKRKKELLKEFDSIICNFKQIKKEDWKLCIFNEMFFSKWIPVSQRYMKNIVNNSSMIEEDRHTLTHINFLYYEKRNVPLSRNEFERIIKQLSSSRTLHSTVYSRFSPYGKIALQDYINRIKQLAQPQNYLVNMSQLLWRKRAICFYKKSSYCSENDELLSQGYIYDIGDGKDHKYPNMPEPFDSVANVVSNNISTEICYDLYSGIREENNWENNPGLGSKIHILVSNWVSLYNSFFFLPPNGKLIIHADPILLNENVFAVRKDVQPQVDFATAPVWGLINKPGILNGRQFIYDERLKASFDISKIIKNNHIEAIRLNFCGRKYIIQSYDVRDAICKMQRGY